MGAWGYALYQSDHDIEMMAHLDDELGLVKLHDDELEANPEKIQKDELANGFVRWALRFPSNPEETREFLDTPDAVTGISPLQKALSKWQAKAAAPPTRSWFSMMFGKNEWDPHPGYAFVLLGACAMGLGCKLTADNLTAMRSIFTECGLMPDALKQVDAALNGPGRYNGQPWFFDSPGLIETANNAPPDAPMFMNVPAPHGFLNGPDSRPLIANIKARMAAYKLEKENYSICGAETCEAIKNKAGGCLLVCFKCKARKYCSRECQMDHWKSHKLVCVKAA